MVKITEVIPGSRAAKCGIATDDTLVSINGREIRDVLDYRFYLAEEKLTLVLTRDGEEYTAEITKGMYDDIGLGFETPLMDKKHRCENKCIFCFIDQLPEGMRESLYFKDDDSRLSFLHGNYITLTNLDRRDIDRIIEMHISPVNVSVHTTDPDLRVKMMKNKRAGQVLSYLRILADAGIKLRGQIVLCRGVNDGENLMRSLRELEELYPAMDSVSVVPAGITGFREGLYPLEPYSPEECAEIIQQITDYSDGCVERHGERIFYPADEFYVKSGTPIPPPEFWGEYSQIENGVGMLSSFDSELDMALANLYDDEYDISADVSVATGEAAYEFMCRAAGKIAQKCKNVKIRVYCIKNNFFGGEITVTGLLTGKDIAEQLAGEDLGERLLLSSSTLRSEGDLFLCGMTPDELSEKLSVPLCFTDNDGAEFLYTILGI
ncbi:MAG: DUF512 domain-containing protein [Clostridia bacterium]|nr:DUF512 domain-containing protein [Clostridia bacterium]